MMMQQYKGKTVQEWSEEAERQKKNTGKEYMVIKWGPNNINTWPLSFLRHVPEYAQVVYRTDEAVK